MDNKFDIDAALADDLSYGDLVLHLFECKNHCWWFCK